MIRRAGWALVLVVACAPSRRSVAPTTGVRAQLLSFDAIRPFVNDGAPIVRRGDRFSVADVSAPPTANGAIELSPGDRRFSIRVVPRDAANVAGRVEANTLVYANAFREADLAFVLKHDRIEELRVARSEAAARALRWTLHRSPALAATREVDDHLELADARGLVRFRTDPAFAVDSTQRRVRVRLAVRPLDALSDEIVATIEDAASLHYPIAIDPVWRAVTALAAPRAYHATVRLPSGKLMLVGGASWDALSTTQVFDPSTGAWSAAASMNAKRAFPSVTLLSSGKLFVLGGVAAFWYSQTSAEIYDETTDTWTAAADAPSAHGAEAREPIVTLPSGKVFVGTDTGCELYDPAANKWTIGPTHATGLAGMGFPIVLPDGKVLSIGTRSTTSDWWDAGSAVEIFDPATTKAVAVASMSTRRSGHEAVRLSNGKILVAGGTDRIIGWGGGTTAHASTELYDPATNTWTAGPPMSTRRFNFASALLSSGRWLVAGSDMAEPRDGLANSTAELFDPASSRWLRLPPMREGRGRTSMAATLDGRALIAGGENAYAAPWFGQMATTSVELFDAKCAIGTDCPSGFCVDGVCCDTACTGACMACDEPGKVGTCSPISGAPRPAHATCGAFLCKSGSCATSCTSSSDCLNGAPCSGGVCKLGALADKCVSDTDCASGQCWDGVCCNMHCGYPCVACDLPGRIGSCGAITGLPRPDARRTKCGKHRDCSKRCDGKVAWSCDVAAPAAGTACGAEACIAGVETHAGTCDGTDTCSGGEKPCTPYACDAAVCKTRCTVDTDCAAPFVCVGSACVESKAGCSPDRATAYAKDGTPQSCAPYLCVDKACATTCGECAPGYRCEASACVSADAGVPDTGVPPVDSGNVVADTSVAPAEEPEAESLYGCAAGHARDARGAALFLLALISWRRRR